MLTPHEFKRTRAARPRPDLGGDDLADLGTTGWYVGRFSTDKHLSIGKAHAVLPKIGLYWPPVVGPCGPPSVAVSVWLAVLVAASTGRRRGRPPWWRPSVVGWCAGWRSLPLVSVRRAGGRSVAGVRPWPWWPFSWPLAAFRPSAGPLVRRGPFVARGGPFGPCVLALSFGSIPPPLVARRRWCAVLVLACLVCAVGGRGGRVAGRPCWCRWCRCHCAVPWPVARVAGRQYGPPCGGVLVVSLRRALLGRVPFPSVRAGVRRGRSLAVSVRPCWCAGVRSVAGVRFLPFSLPVVARLGRRWCWCPSLVLAARVGLVLGLADWLAVWALPVAGGGGWRCLRLRWCLPCQ